MADAWRGARCGARLHGTGVRRSLHDAGRGREALIVTRKEILELDMIFFLLCGRAELGWENLEP